MTIVDTNVASEMMKARPAVQVLEWLNAQSTSSLFITAPTRAKIFLGIELLAAGRKREALHRAAGEMFRMRFACTRGAAVATRDLRDFANCGIELIDPWA